MSLYNTCNINSTVLCDIKANHPVDNNNYYHCDLILVIIGLLAVSSRWK